MEGPIDIYYDEEGDFLEITIVNPPHESYVEDVDEDVYLRKSEDGKIIGIGILNFKNHSHDIKDILKKGKIEPSGPLAVEANDSETGALPRLVLYFDRRNYGRLKHMVDQINLMGD